MAKDMLCKVDGMKKDRIEEHMACPLGTFK